MRKGFERAAIVLATWLTLMAGRCVATVGSKALRQAELLALVAGNALPENVVQQIVTNGLAFHPDAAYRNLLTNAGADARILKAVDAAKANTVDSGAKANADVLQHLSEAAKLMRAGRDDDAARELTAAVTAGFRSAECGFVMGELLQREQDWERAEVMYDAVLNENPNFPEAHTKLSYVLYREGNSEEALHEARAALAVTPENAEAHKNAGLALAGMKKFDEAAVEYKQALRLKPDYKPVRYGLAHLARGQGF
jgi:tetratricopeptide (TPR) repeat protein